ncbi:hypothetical protein DPMN_026819 [Dreissena polymorpha]|uniref:Uncharacterized protein n=1 Tax=Dreissena polymorpha TaxID=45954 RepID=A0A9D4RD35_DREPO|nr:hypothetical protein DPMN_026819 [Dreissena polymorpha]
MDISDIPSSLAIPGHALYKKPTSPVFSRRVFASLLGSAGCVDRQAVQGSHQLLVSFLIHP